MYATDGLSSRLRVIGLPHVVEQWLSQTAHLHRRAQHHNNGGNVRRKEISFSYLVQLDRKKFAAPSSIPLQQDSANWISEYASSVLCLPSLWLICLTFIQYVSASSSSSGFQVHSVSACQSHLVNQASPQTTQRRPRSPSPGKWTRRGCQRRQPQLPYRS
jgi:hypothetical protein